ncbi:Glycogen synthase [Penicillium cf. griseofulvum]|nr:Glycogen synthase [Penicillium cf. griseofulvum]
MEENGEPIKRDVRNHMLFEVATEVANRVGGIYSVLKSKAPVTTAEYGERYTLIGPLNRASAAVEVEELTPTNPAMRETIQSMKERGIEMVYGRWLIEGAPRVLLIDTSTGYKWLDEWKGDLWTTSAIPSPAGDNETNEAIVFGYLVAWFLGEYIAHDRRRAVIAHFHEWLAGVALPLTKKRHMDLTTVFTTHATLLGRYLCAGSVDFYNNLQYFDVDAEAGKRGIYHRYCIERAATHACDVFTTVSHITAFESEHLLKRKPDGVLPNGLNVKKFSAMHEFQNLHSQAKEKINDFVRGHFYGHNDFDLDNTLYLFTAGRYEYRNKGVDMFIESLARLNHRLKTAGSTMTVVAFIIMPAQTSSLTVEALKGQAVVKSLRDTIENIEKGIGKRMYERCLSWKEGDNMPDDKDLITSQDRVMLRRRLFGMKRHGLPPIVTHNMHNDSEDPILNQLRRVQLFNHSSDRVKVVFHPEFLNSANPVLPLDYDDFVRGTHLGVFPSYYEPWGYTPAECTVMGVPSITTNLSGFGCYMEELIENSSDYGIYIVDRRAKGVDDSVNQLTDYMFHFTEKSRRQRINQRNRTERLSDLLDWKRMGLEYVKARQLALRRAYPSSFEGQEDYFDIIGGTEQKLSRPLSVPGSPRDRSGMMTPGDFASLQEGHEGLSTEDYIAWKLPEEEEPEEHFPLTLRTRKMSERAASPLDSARGYFKDEGLKVALLEPNDPSDVTEIVGSGKVDMGFKAMIHTLAAKARDFPVTSIGSLLDEPFTGVVYLKSSGITEDFRSLKGKRIGYVGEFGKIQIDELTKYYGMTADDYTAVRCGMNITKAIIQGTIDAGIGLENVQMVELEEWLAGQNRPRTDVQMLRIDQLAELGCCCFCSILYIANDAFIAANPEKVAAFMRAVKRATDDVLADPAAAYAEYVDFKPIMGTDVNRKIFERSFAYFSRDLKNVKRDWTKVTNYGKRLGILDADFVPNYTNEFLSWGLDADSADPIGDQKRMAALQQEVAAEGGYKRLEVKASA